MTTGIILARQIRSRVCGPRGFDEVPEHIVPKKQASRWLDPWLRCDHTTIPALADEVLANHLARSLGQRRLRETDRQNLHRAICIVIANVALATIDGRGTARLSVTLSHARRKRTRYDAPDLGQLPTAVEAVARAGLASLTKSKRDGIASTIAPTAAFMNGLTAWRPALSAKHFSWEPGELIHVSRVERNYEAGSRVAKPVDYEDSEHTQRMRTELETINTALAEARLTFCDDGGPAVPIRKTNMRRIFNTGLSDAEFRAAPHFDLGGRLYGAWWESLERSRRRHIRIDGEWIAEIDVSATLPRLAYLWAGLAPPEGDLYAGIVQDDPEGRWREGVKSVVNAMLFRRPALTRLPRGARELLPPDASA